MLVPNFGSELPLREELVLRERLDRHARRVLTVVGADGCAVGEIIGGVVIPLQPGIECKVRIKRIADVPSQTSPLLRTAC